MKNFPILGITKSFNIAPNLLVDNKGELNLYLTKLTDETIKVYKAEHEKLKVSGISFDSRKIKKECYLPL